MTKHAHVVTITVAMLIAIACNPSLPPQPESAVRSITGQSLARDITVLASDEYEGRKPGTHGEELTVSYIEKRSREIGLTPGNPDGSFMQRVLLRGITSNLTATVTIRGRKIPLATPRDIAARTFADRDHVAIVDSEVVFAGYGIEAPEYGWSDYAGVDVHGKTVLVLLGEPSRPSPGAVDAASSDARFFKGVEQSFHGTTACKREVAFQKGASAIVFLFGQAAYPSVFSVFQNEALTVQDEEPGVPVQAVMPAERVGALLAPAGFDLDLLAGRAAQPGFRAVPLGISISFDIATDRRTLVSRNVVARLEGSDARLRDEHVIVCAHWDALGRDPSAPGDQVWNGAVDNAGGIAQMLAIALAFRKLPRAPRRSILFLATTAEEAGLLGARYYVGHPLYPLSRTLAAVNFDNFFAYGATADVINYGDGQSDLDEVLRKVVAMQSRRVVPDPFPEEGFYFRMDHFPFAEAGVPAISPSMGVEAIGRPPGYGKQQADAYLSHDYHQPSDEVRPNWDYAGAVQDAQMGFLIALRVAEANTWPQWKPGSEFRARRERMLTGRR